MSMAIDGLVNDHNAILAALNVFSRILDSIENENNLNLDELYDFLDFLMEFADKYHFGKEESILFPALIAYGVPDRGGPINVMMAEHIQSRGYIHTMYEALEDPEDFSRFVKTGRAYVKLTKNHIQKENNVLFPMADQVISSDQLDSIYQNLNDFERKVIASSRFQELQSILDGLQAKYQF